MSRRLAPYALAVLGFVAAAAWPLANFMAVNYSQISAGAYGRPDDLYLVTAGFVLGGLLLGALAAIFGLRVSARVMVVLTVATFLLFASVWLRGMLRGGGFAAHSTLLTAAIMCVALGVAWLLSRFEPFRLLVSLASVLALVMALSGLIPQVLARPGPDSTPSTPVAGNVRALSGENVYVVILDEYAGEGTLQDLGLDNRPFVDQMVARGFKYDAQARSNYVATHVSLMSVLEGDYPVTDRSVQYSDRSQFYPAATNNGYAPKTLRDLEASGYALRLVSNWWASCSEAVFHACIESPDLSRSYAIETFLAPTLVGEIVDAIMPEPDARRDAALELFVDQSEVLLQNPPFLLFVHHLAPHPPYTRNSDCTFREPPESDGDLNGSRRAELYIAATQCVNTELLEAVDLIQQKDPSAIIVVLSDHGSDFKVDWNAPLAEWSEAALEERTDILSLRRLPDACKAWDRDGLGQANVMRLVWSCLARTQPTFLPEHTFVTAYENHPEFGQVARVR